MYIRTSNTLIRKLMVSRQPFENQTMCVSNKILRDSLSVQVETARGTEPT